MTHWSPPTRTRRCAKAIEGRVVLIGSAFGHSGDDHHSPVHGKVPGVFLHAMALDNLFRFGDRVWISAPALLGSACLDIGWDSLAMLGLLGVLALLDLLAETFKWRLWLELLCAIAITGAAGAFVAFWLVWPPFNWLGVLSLFLVVSGWRRLSLRLKEDNRSS